jgi:hypothetical protein
MLKTLSDKFANTGVDLAPVLEDFQDKVTPSR